MMSLIRSFLLRLIAVLALLMPLLMLMVWVSNMVKEKDTRHVILTIHFVSGVYGVPPGSVHAAPSPQAQLVHSPSYVAAPVVPASGRSIVGGPSLTPALIDQVLATAASPAQGTGQALYSLSQQYHIDDAYALAVFAEESSFGKGGAAVADHSLGNIICAGYPTCDGRFRSYGTWQEGYEDFYRLLADEYIPRGLVTVEQIEPVYAPSNENDTALYVHNVEQFMSAFRQAQGKEV